MKKRMILTVVLAVLLLCSVLFPAAAAERFTDVPADAWYVSYVDYAVEHGIFNGISATQFVPGKTMNRAQFVQVLANLSEIDTTDTNVTTPFSDVPAGKWFSPAVKWAYENGIVNGKGGGKFAPGDNVNRQEMCTMLARYADYLGVRLTKTAEKTVFADDASISSWAKDAVYACQQTELINGIGGNKFNPKGTTPRSQGATLFARFHQYLEANTHTHVYGQWTVTVAPTCQSEGTITYSCTECSVSYSETLPIIDHDYQDGICTMCGASSVVIKYGDCNGDDKINGQDMTRLLRYLANFDYTTGNSTIEIESGADCNGDGTINGKDMTRLLRYLANFDHATGESTIKLGK